MMLGGPDAPLLADDLVLRAIALEHRGEAGFATAGTDAPTIAPLLRPALREALRLLPIARNVVMDAATDVLMARKLPITIR